MAVSVKLTPELEARLTARARSTGERLEALIQRILERGDAVADVEGPLALSGPEKADAFRAWAMSFPASFPELSMESVSRESIYRRD